MVSKISLIQLLDTKNDPNAWALARPRKRRSRWSKADEDKTYVPGMPTQLPPNLTPDQEKMYICRLMLFLLLILSHKCNSRLRI